ncbi:uncharacterized protein L203_103183 [Cryptococcus depauperatus CBS 7841]|uniref:Uncharacterized protein n=1 Tax=Cryptococcus depauperatus CBS 7841 TaxID=1295531 RepID=A0A1E3IRV1_9TREE|nr:hypothetical protein L203_01540 [Cryptococcus depauperatus CBS 7841]
MGFNSPIPVRLQEETKKAANILRSFVDVNNNGLDKVVPRTVLERATGFAIFTVFKAGLLFSARAGSGVVVARLQDGTWSPPSAIGLGGLGFGGQAGAEVTDFLIVLNSRAAVASFMSAGSLTIGGNLSVAVGPLGRNAEGSGAVNTKGRLAAMYSYSKTKGLFGGVSVEGSVIVERQDANRLAYGGNPTSKQILSGAFDPPNWANVLTDQLKKCTSLPGGQQWRDKDEKGEGGGMGYNTPDKGRNGAGYAFGEGIGAGGSIPVGGRKRAGSLFSNKGDDPPDSPRPGNSRRSSILNPFSSGANSPRKASTGPQHTSEAYNAGLTWDSNGPMGMETGNASIGRLRSDSNGLRREGEVPAPFSYMGPNKASGREENLSKDWISTSNTPKPFHNVNDRRATESDLLGQWDTDGVHLSATFSRLSSKDTTHTRNDPLSKRPVFSDKLEDTKPLTPTSPAFVPAELDYNPRESISQIAKMDMITGEAQFATQKTDRSKYNPPDNTRPFSSYISSAPKKEFSPFDDDAVGRLRSSSVGRPFQDYQNHSSGRFDTQTPSSFQNTTSRKNILNANVKSSPIAEIHTKPGLDDNDGYARAVALYDFKPSANDDLGFKSGDVVIVLDSVGDSSEWWEGRLASQGPQGKRGIFPCTYVEVLVLPKDLKGRVTRSDLRRRIAKNEFD